MDEDYRPWTRWWWFADSLRRADITAQLEWLRDNGFGGAEIGWLGPTEGCRGSPEPFLSPGWADDAAFAAAEAARLGLGLDLTFGSQWPFGGEWVTEEDSVQTWNGPHPYRLRDPWPGPEGGKGRIVNHLDRNALERYAAPLAEALGPAIRRSGGAFFCDSWEIPANPPLWTEGFAERFEERFGYDLRHLMNYLEYHAHARYDYRRLLSELVISEFYEPFTAICHRAGARSRAQCHGAPADLVAAYAAVDVPETETLLFDPHFASFAASAAAIGGKPRISCESFTALYGLSRSGPPGLEKEQLADIKLVADAMFAHGVNQVVWHGMPYQGEGETKRFGATCHVGPDAAFAERLPAFNDYLARVSAAMGEGAPWTDVGVYLPVEDQWMRHLLPEEDMRPSAHYHWELQHVRFPRELEGHQPCWVSGEFLGRAAVDGSAIRIGAAAFSCLWVDCEWIARDRLAGLIRIAESGGSVVVRGSLREPGYRRSPDFEALRARLLELAVPAGEALPPALLSGSALPEFRVRRGDGGWTLFLAHPKSREVRYPLSYGQSFCGEVEKRSLAVRAFGQVVPLEAVFEPYQSLLFRFDPTGGVEQADIFFDPGVPERSEPFPKDHRYPGYRVVRTGD